jgi:hypothetical protein
VEVVGAGWDDLEEELHQSLDEKAIAALLGPSPDPTDPTDPTGPATPPP